MYQWPMVPDQGTQYEENPSSHHRGMREDKHPDRQTDPFLYIPRFHLGGVGNNKQFCFEKDKFLLILGYGHLCYTDALSKVYV